MAREKGEKGEKGGEERREEKRRGKEGAACHWDNSGQAFDGPHVFSRVSGWLGRLREYPIA